MLLIVHIGLDKLLKKQREFDDEESEASTTLNDLGLTVNDDYEFVPDENFSNNIRPPDDLHDVLAIVAARTGARSPENWITSVRNKFEIIDMANLELIVMNARYINKKLRRHRLATLHWETLKQLITASLEHLLRNYEESAFAFQELIHNVCSIMRINDSLEWERKVIRKFMLIRVTTVKALLIHQVEINVLLRRNRQQIMYPNTIHLLIHEGYLMLKREMTEENEQNIEQAYAVSEEFLEIINVDELSTQDSTKLNDEEFYYDEMTNVLMTVGRNLNKINIDKWASQTKFKLNKAFMNTPEDILKHGRMMNHYLKMEGEKGFNNWKEIRYLIMGCYEFIMNGYENKNEICREKELHDLLNIVALHNHFWPRQQWINDKKEKLNAINVHTIKNFLIKQAEINILLVKNKLKPIYPSELDKIVNEGLNQVKQEKKLFDRPPPIIMFDNNINNEFINDFRDSIWDNDDKIPMPSTWKCEETEQEYVCKLDDKTILVDKHDDIQKLLDEDQVSLDWRTHDSDLPDDPSWDIATHTSQASEDISLPELIQSDKVNLPSQNKHYESTNIPNNDEWKLMNDIDKRIWILLCKSQRQLQNTNHFNKIKEEILSLGNNLSIKFILNNAFMFDLITQLTFERAFKGNPETTVDSRLANILWLNDWTRNGPLTWEEVMKRAHNFVTDNWEELMNNNNNNHNNDDDQSTRDE